MKQEFLKALQACEYGVAKELAEKILETDPEYMNAKMYLKMFEHNKEKCKL